jgi:hypothetical protein
VFNVFPFDPNQSGAFGPHVAVNVEAHLEPVFIDRSSDLVAIGPVPPGKDHAQRNRDRNEAVSVINGAKSRWRLTFQVAFRRSGST